MIESPIYPTMRLFIDNEWQSLNRNQIEPWFFMNAGPAFMLKDFYGKTISYGGIRYEGSPQMVFWGTYIEPFLQDIIERSFSKARYLCIEKDVDLILPTNETANMLNALISRTYSQMSSVEHTLLRIDGSGKNFSRDINSSIKEMTDLVQMRLEAELASWKPKNKFTSLFQRHPFIFWLVTTTIAFASLITNFLRRE